MKSAMTVLLCHSLEREGLVEKGEEAKERSSFLQRETFLHLTNRFSVSLLDKGDEQLDSRAKESSTYYTRTTKIRQIASPLFDLWFFSFNFPFLLFLLLYSLALETTLPEQVQQQSIFGESETCTEFDQ